MQERQITMKVVKVSVSSGGGGDEIRQHLEGDLNQGWQVAAVFPMGEASTKGYHKFFVLLTKTQ